MNSQLQEVPVRVRWHGWESDTYTLRRAGWKVFVNEQMASDRFEKEIHLAVRDPEAKIMIMGVFRISAEQLFAFGGSPPNGGLVQLLCSQGIDMDAYRATDMVHVYPDKQDFSWSSTKALALSDGFATLNLTQERRRFDELQIFKTVDIAKEIIIPQASVTNFLDSILQLQFPEQQRIKQLDQVKKPVIQAKIYSLAA